MLRPPISLDAEPWTAGDARARFFYRCRDCETVFTSVSEPVMLRFRRQHGWDCAMQRAARALQA